MVPHSLRTATSGYAFPTVTHVGRALRCRHVRATHDSWLVKAASPSRRSCKKGVPRRHLRSCLRRRRRAARCPWPGEPGLSRGGEPPPPGLILGGRRIRRDRWRRLPRVGDWRSNSVRRQLQTPQRSPGAFRTSSAANSTTLLRFEATKATMNFRGREPAQQAAVTRACSHSGVEEWVPLSCLKQRCRRVLSAPSRDAKRAKLRGMTGKVAAHRD